MIKAILFDLDGTLIDTNDLIIKSFKHAFRTHLNIEVDEKVIVNFFGEPLDLSFKTYDEENVDTMVNIYREFNEKNHDELAKSFEGIEEALKGLKEIGVKIAVVTSKRRLLAERGLKLFKLKEYFDVIVTPEDTLLHKPNGEPVAKACQLLDIKTSEAIMVGDSHNDILCGRNAGSKTCLVKYTALAIEDLNKYNPDYVVEDLVELVNIVSKENK